MSHDTYEDQTRDVSVLRPVVYEHNEQMQGARILSRQKPRRVQAVEAYLDELKVAS